ncbi:MAG: hypothetical protein ACKV2V_28090 [Blastocatellia bacterium]
MKWKAGGTGVCIKDGNSTVKTHGVTKQQPEQRAWLAGKWEQEKRNKPDRLSFFLLPFSCQLKVK